jgi:hypothetical protein
VKREAAVISIIQIKILMILFFILLPPLKKQGRKYKSLQGFKCLETNKTLGEYPFINTVFYNLDGFSMIAQG